MTDVLKMSRKALTVGVVLSTILWSMMATVLVAPLKASAAGCTSGSLIKGTLAAVYYCGADGKRYVFTNDKNYFTWYPDFSGVMIISDADLATLQIGGNVTYRPGVKMIKIQTDPKVYAVAHGGVLRHVPSESCAATLYGSDWNLADTQDVSDAFFTNYSVGNAINAACTDYDKNAEMSSSQTINQDKGLTAGPGPVSGLNVSKASDSPAAATVPGGAVGVNFLKFNVSNGTGSTVTVDGATLRRTGPGATSDFENVYMFEGDTRLTTGRTVNSSTNEVNFNSLGWTLAAGQTRTFWVAASISAAASAGNVHAFELTSLSTGSAQAQGLPVMGSNMTLAGTDVGTLAIVRTGSLTNPKVGQLAAKVAEFQLSAGAAEDLMVKRITLFQAGNLSRSNLTNLKLKVAGQEVASAAAVNDKDRIVFVLVQPTLLEKGNTKTYEVWADIGGGARANDTIRIYAEEDVDVYAIGQTFGYGADVDRTNGAGDGYDNADNDGTDASWTTVEGGQITITFNGPAAKDLATNGKDLEVFNFTIASQVNAEVRNLRMAITAPGEDDDDDDDTGLKSDGTTDAANYRDIKVVDVSSSQTVAGPKDVLATDADSDATQNLTYTDVFTLTAGQSRTFKVLLDVANETALNGTTVRMDLLAFQGSDIRNLDNSTFVATTDIVPSGTISGNTHTVRNPSLTMTGASSPIAQTYIQGTQNAELFGLNLKAGDASDIRVSSITLQGRVDADTAINADMNNGCDVDAPETKLMTDILLSAKLWNGTTQQGDTESPTTSPAGCTTNTGGELQFTNLNITVPKGQTVTLKLTGTLSSSIANLNDLIDFQIDSNADVSAQDMDGNSLVAGTNLTGATVDGANMTIAGNGVMTYVRAPDDSESEAGLVIGGTNGTVMAKYRFTAQNEDLKLSKVRMALGSTAAAQSVSSLSLYDGSTLVGGPVSVTISGTTTFADFSGMNFLVAKDASKTLTLKANLAAVGGSSGAPSGTDLTATLCNGDNTSTLGVCGVDNGTFEVRGTSGGSSTVDTQGNSGDVAGNEKRNRKTKPTISAAALPSTTLTNGTVVVSRFTVTADSAEQVSLKKLTFELSNNGLTLIDSASASGSGVREVGQSSNIGGTTQLIGVGCTANGTCTMHVLFTSEQAVAAGTSKTYELRVDVTGAGPGDSLGSKLIGDTSQVTGELDNGGAALPNLFSLDDLDGTDNTGAVNFAWSDNSAIPHNDTVENNTAADGAGSNDWTNGRFVKILPSDTQTLTF